MARIVVLSGPSCVGKGPLMAAMGRFYPEIVGELHTLVLYNSRSARPGEEDGVDYHFRRRQEIEELRGEEGWLVMDVRGDLQAVELGKLEEMLVEGDVFFEGNPFVGSEILGYAGDKGVESVGVFLSPLSKDEIGFLKGQAERVDIESFVADVMRRKLLRRMSRQKSLMSKLDLEEVERRACSAWREMKMAGQFGCVIANHDGEDSENWDMFYWPIGDARRTMLALVELLKSGESKLAEKWEREILE